MADQTYHNPLNIPLSEEIELADKAWQRFWDALDREFPDPGRATVMAAHLCASFLADLVTNPETALETIRIINSRLLSRQTEIPDDGYVAQIHYMPKRLANVRMSQLASGTDSQH